MSKITLILWSMLLAGIITTETYIALEQASVAEQEQAVYDNRGDGCFTDGDPL